MQVLNICILYAKYYIYIQRLFNNNTLDLYDCLTQKYSSNSTLYIRIYKIIVEMYAIVTMCKMCE